MWFKKWNVNWLTCEHLQLEAEKVQSQAQAHQSLLNNKPSRGPAAPASQLLHSSTAAGPLRRWCSPATTQAFQPPGAGFWAENTKVCSPETTAHRLAHVGAVLMCKTLSLLLGQPGNPGLWAALPGDPWRLEPTCQGGVSTHSVMFPHSEKRTSTLGNCKGSRCRGNGLK